MLTSNPPMQTLTVRTLFILLACLSQTASLLAGDTQPLLWDQIQLLSEKGKYEEVLTELKAQPEETARYYYNLGTTYYRLKKMGQAVAYLEKANRMLPHDLDTQNNLSFAKEGLAQLLGPENLDPSSTWAEQVADRVSLDEARALLGFLGLCVVLLWMRAYLSERNLSKAFSNPAGWIGIFGFLITVGVYWVQRRADSVPPVVCLEASIIRSGPGDSFLQLGKASIGSKYRSLGLSPGVQPSEEWRQIRYSHDGIGWMRSTSLLPL